MHFFVFLTQLYLIKPFTWKIYKTAILNTINISHFQLKYQFSNFVWPFFIFLKCFCRYLKAAKCANFLNGNKLNSKTKGGMSMKISIDVKYTNRYRTISPIFDIYFQIWIMLQSVLIGRLPFAMATILKNRFHVLCAMYSYTIYPSMVNMQHFVFEIRLLQCLPNKRPCIVTIATRQMTKMTNIFETS